ncbi:MAG TPA: lytic transglycosylase domain-containing protein [Gemmatimonadaceae bacterium]|nr:lytic transglycosylase domain-containing protein [Gemmatimonadaceae bacterium]
MRKHQRYAYRGDELRRRRRIRHAIILLGLGIAVALLIREQPRAANATAAPFSFGSRAEAEHLRHQLDSVRGELRLTAAQLERAEEILAFSGKYHVNASLAASVYDIAIAEGIEPALAFRLVQVESEFNPHATSPVGALGLTQLMPATARYFRKGVTTEQLYTPEINLHIGFRYLRSLIREYDGDVKLALLVYNRGPAAVARARAEGKDPRNGYSKLVTQGYHGDGVVD